MIRLLLLRAVSSFDARQFSSKVSKRARPPADLFRERDIVEQFVRGGSAGGQAVARSSNCVVLRHAPTGIVVRCHATRSREQNRARARRVLAERIDELVNGDRSVRARAKERSRRRSSKARARARAKYGGGGGKSTKRIRKSAPLKRRFTLTRGVRRNETSSYFRALRVLLKPRSVPAHALKTALYVGRGRALWRG